MNAFERFVFLLQGKIATPVPYGWYHLVCLALTVGLTVLLCLRCRDAGERTVDRLLFVAWLLMVVAEVYKQIVFSMDVTDGVATWSYSWYSFPYQFCSTPIYVLPFAILGRGRVREAALAFMMSFSLFGGLAVMVYPGDVYVPTLGVDVQTMLHHGLQVVLGIYLAVYLRHRLGLRHFAKALPVFAVAVALALLLNVTVYHALAASGGEVPTFNMFFISPYFDCTLPLVGAISAALPYPVFLLVYLVGFSLAAFIVYGAVWGLYRLTQRRGAA
ncbi:MAG: YwaF family protein [Clostridia bacterium]|nr:YwaF family protein [Clostridia bacterium]